MATLEPGAIRITEYMRGGTNGEFVEFTNVGGSAVDMTGWSFDDSSRTSGSFSLSSFGVVQPGESVILTEDTAAAFRTAWGLPNTVKVIGGLTQNLGASDEINLYDNTNILIDRLTYVSSNFDANNRSAWTDNANLGINNQVTWQLSAIPDAKISYASTGNDIGNPGGYIIQPGVTIRQSGASTDIAEGGATDSYTVVLNTQPTAIVTITLNLGTQTSTNTNTLTFTATNWNVAQTVTVTAVDDAVQEGTHTGTITHTASSTDATYNNISVASVTANITDNDVSATPTVNLSVSSNAGTEAGTTVITVTATASISGGVSESESVNLGVTGTGITTGDYNLSSSVITFTKGQTVGTATFTVVDDAVVEGTETATLTISSPTAGISLGTTTTQNIVITDNDVAVTKISAIQGSGTTAALTGTQTIEGIVTRTFLGTTKLNGFYVQEEDADSDGNAATSEAIFVFDSTGKFTGNVGDKVRITGTVAEFASTSGTTTSSLTQLDISSGTVTNLGASTLPTTVNVQLPTTSATDLERYEGMLVNLSAATGNLTVTENFQLGRYGQVVLAVDGASNQAGTDARLDQYTQFNAPSVSGYTAYLAELAKRKIYLDDGSSTQNVDPTIFARGGNPLSATNTLRGGDTVASITGILDERFEGYRIQTSTGVNFTATNLRPNTPPAVGGTLKVASFNVLNYFNDLDTNTNITTNGLTFEPRGANTATEFNRQRDKIIQAIITSGADVLGLMELENNGYGANSAIQNLVNELNGVAGPGTYTFITPGTRLGTDAITVGLIYKSGKVTPVGAAATMVDGYGSLAFDLVGRKPLAQTFQQNSTGEQFTAVVNHFKSKGSSSGGVGDADAGDGQGFSNGTRTRQAQDLASWLATKPTGTNDADYLLLGDFNAYAQENPITTLASAGYGNLLLNTSYSYVFDGQVGALDHALGSASLTAQVTGAEKWHINADEPTVLDYNTEFKTANQINSLYEADQFRSSDHDPVLVGLSLNSAPTNLTLSSSSINENVSANSVVGTFSTTDPTIDDTSSYSFVSGTNDNSAFTISGNQLQIKASPDFETKSTYNIRVRTTDNGGLSFEKDLTININNVNEAPTVLNGPNGSPGAVGPTNNNDDFTDQSSNIPSGLALGATFNPDAVNFTNTVSITGNQVANISLLPKPPANTSDLPNGTVVTISANNGDISATYTYNGTTFTFTSGSGGVGGNPIGATNPVRIDGVPVNGTANYAVSVDLPANTPLSNDIQRGFPVPITAFIDSNGNGLADVEVTNITIDRVYTFLQVNKAASFSADNGDGNVALINTLDNTPTFIENGAAVILDNNVQIIDPELTALNNGSGNYADSTLTLSRNGGANAEDIFSLNTTGALFTVSNSNIQSDGQTFATFTQSDGTLTISFTGSATTATQALVNDVLRHINYSNSSENPSSSVQINWVFADGNTGSQGTGGSQSVQGSITVSVTPVNDAPVVTTISGNSSYTENAPATVIDSGILVSDIDSANLSSATVSITSGFVTGQDILSFTNQNGITGNYNNNTGILTLTGSATVANYQTALSSITYTNSSENPSTTTRTISYSVNDGSLNSNLPTRNITITAVNDAPVVSLNNQVTAIAENTATRIKVANVTITDDALGTNNLSVSGTDASFFEVDATGLYIKANTVLDFETKTSYSVTVDVDDTTVGNTPDSTANFTLNVTNVNEAPTNLTLSANTIAENTVIGTGIKIGDITITDPDATGNNNVLTVEGTDAANFEIRNSTELYFKGTSPDFETKPSYSINLKSTDGALTYSKAFTVNVTNVNEAPTAINLNNQVTAIAENTSTTTRIKVADIAITNDALGTNTLSVSGTDASSFEVDATGLYIKANTVLNYEAKTSYSVTVNVDDSTVGATPDATTNFTLNITDVNEAPTAVSLNNQITAIAENTSTTTRIKVADIAITNDALGTNSLSVSGTDASFFEVDATGLYIKANTVLNYEAKTSYSVTVNVDDSTVGATPDATTNFTVNVTNVNEAPTVTDAGFSIEENSIFNTLIGQVVASDPDANEKITFGITSGNTDVDGNGKTAFAIDSSTGEIKVNDPSDLNFEKNPIFNLGITATDAGGLTAQSLFAVNLKNVVEPVTFGKSDSDVFTLLSEDNPKPALLVTVNSNNAKQTSEIGIFIVDDAAGTIDGIAPNQSGYAEKALSKAKVLFSIIDNQPSGFSESGLSRLLQFNDTARIRFYTINDKSATTDSVLNSKAYDKVNFSPIKDLSLTETSGGFSINFNGLDITIKPSEDTLAIGTGLQDKNEGEVLDLTQGFDTTAFSQVKAEFTVNREAAFNNFVGFYKIENAKGDIKKADGSIVSVGQSGYIQAAIAGQISGIDLTAANQSTQTSSGIFQARSIFAPFIVINGNPSAILDNNPNNDPAVYFPFLGANTDKVDHIRLLGNNTFGFEDLPSGGDLDYNDIIVKVKLTPVA